MQQKLAVIFFVAFASSCSPIDQYQLAPITTSGSIGNSVSTRTSPNVNRRLTNNVKANLDAKSYIWQPWLATVDGGIAVANIINRSGASKSDALTGSGRISLGILPVSKYPATISYEHMDSSVSGNFTSTDFVTDRLSVNSRAVIFQDLKALMTLTLDDISQPDFGDESRREASVSLNKLFDADVVNLGFRYSDRDFDSITVKEAGNQQTTLVGTLDYVTRRFENIVTNSSTTLVSSDTDDQSQTRERLTLQAITTGQWRPENLPFTVNGAWRSLNEKIDTKVQTGSGSSSSSTAKLHSGTIGINYPVTPRLTANTGITATARDVGRDSGGSGGSLPDASGSSESLALIGNVRYQSLATPIGQFQWQWNTGTSLNFSAESGQGLRNNESVNIGHGITRRLYIPFLGASNFSGRQTVAASRGGTDGEAVNLGHRINFFHSSAEEGARTFVQASLSDRRDITSATPREFQLLQIQINRQSNIDITSDWRANLSFQISRNKTRGSDADTVGTANGTLGYSANNLFDVRNLIYRGELVLNSVGLERLISNEKNTGPRSEFFRSDWNNRLEYRIGRLAIILSATVFQEDGAYGDFFSLRVRRSFGN